MFHNALRRATASCILNVYRSSQVVTRVPAINELTSKFQDLPRYLCTKSTENTPADDNLFDLLNQISTADGNTSLTYPPPDDEPHDASSSDKGDSTALPGHRIRGILVPTAETLNQMVGGTAYEKLPIGHVHSSYQNTIIVITDYTGKKRIAYSSGGLIGYRNAKKRSPVAAKAAAMEAGQRAIKQGITHIRVCINGRGKGREPSLKGFVAAGLEVVSISDVSELNWGTHFAKKQRRF